MIGVFIIFTIVKLRKKLISIALFLCSILLLSSVFFVKSHKETLANSAYPELYNSNEEKFVPLKENTVYLTFDDGPGENTLEVIDILDKYDVKATFFVTGKESEQDRNTVKTLYEKGHTVAPHTYTHAYNDIYSSVENYLADFEKIHDYVLDITGYKPTIFRFPGGSINSYATKNKIMDDIIEEMDKRGFVFHDWNVVSGDDTPTVYPAETLLENVVNGAEGKSSPVVLFHDTDYNKTTPEAVELVIKHFKDKGYNFARLEDNTKPIQFAKGNY